MPANIAYLEDLVGVLKKVEADPEPRVKFDMSALWFQKDECGTAACAAGFYCLAYPERDLRLRPSGKDEHWPVLGNLLGFDALVEHFGIKYEEALVLFIDGGVDADKENDTPRDVIERVERLIQKYKAA